MKPHDPVITGVGAVGAFGIGAAALWSALVEARTAFADDAPDGGELPPVRPMTCARLTQFPAAELLGRKGLRAINIESQWFIAASLLALRDAALDAGALVPEEIGVCVGTRNAGLDDYLRFHIDGEVWGPSRVSPLQGPNTGFNAPPSHAAIRLCLRAANLTVSTRTAAIDAIGYAADFVRHGRATWMLAGGVDMFSYFLAQSLVADSAVPAGAPRPYDAGRAFAAPGEGAAVVLVESAERAARRGARVLARVASWTSCFEPALRGASAADAGRRSIQRALAEAGIDAVDAVFSSASGDRGRDAIDAEALAAGLGDAAARAPVCAVKGCVGEWQGASGAVQAVAAVQSLATGIVPPTAGFEQRDPALPPLAVSATPVAASLRRALVFSVDPSGSAASLVLTREDP